jgi:hypothetical protein
MHRLPDAVARPVLERAKARLDTLDLYAEPVRTDRVRIVVFPLFFRVPPFRRFKGYTLWRTILLRLPPGDGTSDDLLTHELCHVWQGQQRRWHMLWTYVITRYGRNPYEREARWAVGQKRAAQPNSFGEGRALPEGILTPE